MSNYKASKIFVTGFLVIFASLVTPSMSTTSCSGPFLNRGNVGRPKCNRYTTGADCAVESVQETAEITCETLMANAVPVDPQLVSFSKLFEANKVSQNKLLHFN
jgi:hypothetical protein